MIQLLMIADDFTGALDSGVHLANSGARTVVVTGAKIDWNALAPDLEVLVVDAETRHLSAEEAYGIVHRIVTEAVSWGIPYFYKKTDSALRGNIGAELDAMLTASGEKQIFFLPAFPKIGRRTEAGVHYIQNVPVAESVFGQDPFEPVTESRVDKLIALQTKINATCLPNLKTAEAVPETPGILVFDAESDQDLFTAGACLREAGKLRVLAGCAGLAAALPELLDLGDREQGGKLPDLDARLLVLCGSVNPITLAQLDTAEQSGFLRLRMEPRQKLQSGYWTSPEGISQLDAWEERLRQGKHSIIESNDPGSNAPTAAWAEAHGLCLEDVRQRISGTFGQILKAISARDIPGTLLVTGGDTLLQCMECMDIHELQPICEMAAGVVLSRFTYQGHNRYAITKSGGFGEPDLLLKLVERIRD